MFAARRKRHGFTLIEVLLVLAILGIITVVTIPNIARSIKGSRLRMGARTVVQAGKYARSMAVLTQLDATVIYKISSGSVVIESNNTNVFDTVTRDFDAVSIEVVEIKDGGTFTEGDARVVYSSNGRCSPYKVGIIDKTGARIVVEVDALSSVTVDMGDYGKE